jgi:hypothetical protein
MYNDLIIRILNALRYYNIKYEIHFKQGHIRRALIDYNLLSTRQGIDKQGNDKDIRVRSKKRIRIDKIDNQVVNINGDLIQYSDITINTVKEIIVQA